MVHKMMTRGIILRSHSNNSTNTSTTRALTMKQAAATVLLMVAVFTASCPYSYAFASSFTSASFRNNNNNNNLSRRATTRSSSSTRTSPRFWTTASDVNNSSNSNNRNDNIDSTQASASTSSMKSAAEKEEEEDDPINDHGVEELLEQPTELVEAAHEFAFVEEREKDELLQKKREAEEQTRLRGGSSTASESLHALPAAPPPLPTLRQYLKFALPCLGLWVAGPLLSLVDTSFVGLSAAAGAGRASSATASTLQSSSAQQLAALGPATTFFDGATYLFAFLNVATTNLYSSARAQKGPDSAKAESVVRTSAQVALRCGLGLMLFLLTCTRPLLRLYIGDKASSTPGLLDAATDYVSIRALSMPTSLLLGVLQAALLGAKDSVTPLIAILYCTVVNVIGDFVLVNRLHWGLQGAAVATTLAQWAATAALLPAARRELVKNGNLNLLSRPASSKDDQSPAASDTVTAKAFLGFAAPVLTLILGKIAAFGFMTHVAAAVPGQPTPLASHQIILSLLFFCSPFLEVLSQTAQTFLPPFLAPVQEHIKRQREKKKGEKEKYNARQDAAVAPWLSASQTVATRLLGLGFVAAAAVASVASLIPAYFGNLITTDATIQRAVQPLAKFLWMGAFFWAPVAVSEGVLLARLELAFLAGIYLLSTALLPAALLRIKYMPGGTVEMVWGCFVVFQMCRALAFTGRIWGGFAVERLLGGAKKSKAQAKTA